MLSFIEFLNEALQPLPYKKGWGDHAEIDGHQVHAQYHHAGKGRYTPVVHVNGSVFKAGEFHPDTAAKITNFAKASYREFLSTVKPTKVRLTGSTPKHAEFYRRVAAAEEKRGFTSKPTRRGAVMTNKANANVHVPPPKVRRDTDNPVHAQTSWMDKKKKKKPDVFNIKKHVKKAIAQAATGFSGGGGDFGGGGSSGSW